MCSRLLKTQDNMCGKIKIVLYMSAPEVQIQKYIILIFLFVFKI